jgi:hypothetical protein
MEILDILKYILPSLVVMLAAYSIVWIFIKNETRRRQMDINLASKEIVIPIRLQAYERIILFLERISPGSLVVRMHQPGYSALHFQNVLLNAIREEFEHNLSQQLYISSPAWEMVKNAREETVKLINTAALRLTENETATSDDLSRKIFEMSLQMENYPTYTAIEKIKKELRLLFNFNIK